MNDVTQIIGRIEKGDEDARSELLPLVYDELRKLARSKLRDEPVEQTLEATALVHEAYIRLVGIPDSQWKNRRHFFAAAAESMRRILIDQARARNTEKRGSHSKTFSLDTVGPITEERASELVELDDALTALEAMDAEKAELVKLKFFVGLSTSDAAQSLGLSLRSAERSWAYSRAWLYRQMATTE